MGKLLASHINVSGNIYCIDIKKKTSLKKKTGNHSSKISSYLPESLSLPLKSSRLFDAKKNVGSLQAIQTLKKSLEGTHPNRLQALKIPQKKSRWFSGRCLLHLFLKDFHNAARHFLWEKKQIMDSFFCKRDEMREATKTMVSHTGNWEGTQMVRKKKKHVSISVGFLNSLWKKCRMDCVWAPISPLGSSKITGKQNFLKWISQNGWWETPATPTVMGGMILLRRFLFPSSKGWIGEGCIKQLAVPSFRDQPWHLWQLQIVVFPTSLISRFIYIHGHIETWRRSIVEKKRESQHSFI